jgi:predicted dehydrogenase
LKEEECGDIRKDGNRTIHSSGRSEKEAGSMNNQKRVRLGLSGCGFFSVVTANAVKKSKNTELVACFDVIPEKRRKRAEESGCDEEKSYEALVARDDIDGVLLTTPNAVHAEQAVLAAERGKHVYVIKPIANTLADGKRMIEACEKAGVVLMVGHPKRRSAGVRKVKALIDEGVLGQLIMAEANGSSAQGFELTPDQFRWKGDDSGCPSGALMTIGVHNADVFNYLFGSVKTVFSFFNKLYIPAEVEDVTVTVCRFASGALGYIGANFASSRTDWMYFYGTQANILLRSPIVDVPFADVNKATASAPRPTQLVLIEKGKEERNIPLASIDAYLEEMDEFARCIRTGDRPETNGATGLASLAIVRAAIDSARTGKPVNPAI